MTINGIVYCKCGAPARPGQRNCRACKNAATQRSALKRKLNVQRLELTVRHLSFENPATQSAFEAKFKTRAVVVRREDPDQDITGHVVGFLPERRVKILDDFGEVHYVHLDRVIEDRGRGLSEEALTDDALADPRPRWAKNKAAKRG